MEGLYSTLSNTNFYVSASKLNSNWSHYGEKCRILDSCRLSGSWKPLFRNLDWKFSPRRLGWLWLCLTVYTYVVRKVPSTVKPAVT